MFEMTVLQDKGIVPVTILHMEGKLDGSNYEKLISEAKSLYIGGARDLVLDLSKLAYLSSAGISALHRVALLFQGRNSASLDEGWSAYHAIDRDRSSGLQEHVKLLNPSGEVERVLGLVGFTSYFEIYADIHSALASFH